MPQTITLPESSEPLISQAAMNPLAIYQAPTPESVTKQALTLLNEGISQGGAAYGRAVLKIAYYLLRECSYSSQAAKSTLRQWTWNTCSPELYDRERSLRIIDKITDKVAKKGLRPRMSPYWWQTELSEADWKEIQTVEQQTLSVLYGILYRHSKVFSNRCGRFYMTYKQMGEAGAGKNRSRLKAQIEQLAKLGKVEILQSNFAPQGRMKKSPNEYRLPHCIRS